MPVRERIMVSIFLPTEWANRAMLLEVVGHTMPQCERWAFLDVVIMMLRLWGWATCPLRSSRQWVLTAHSHSI
jgi:hypothetical protein